MAPAAEGDGARALVVARIAGKSDPHSARSIEEQESATNALVKNLILCPRGDLNPHALLGH
jgi:hypothetical protein